MHIDIDTYAGIGSVIHRWDPRNKIISFLVFIFTLSLVKTGICAFSGLVMALFISLLSRLPLKFLFKKALYPLLLLVPLWVTLPLTSGGEIMYTFGPFNVYYQGMKLALVIYLKSVSIILLFSIMMSTSTFSVTAAAMRSLRFPAKLIDIILFSYRYFFVYLDDLRRVKTALALRGFRNKTGIHSMRTSAQVAGAMLARSFDHSERIHGAMVLRGYSGIMPVMDDFSITYSDLGKTFIFIALSAGLALMDIYGGFL